MAATYRDVDKKIHVFHGANEVSVNPADWSSMANALDPKAVLPSHKKHIEYIPVSPVMRVIRITQDPLVAVGDILVRS